MHGAVPSCPNCVKPMWLSRQIFAYDRIPSQDVFECKTCGVSMSDAAKPDPKILQ